MLSRELIEWADLIFVIEEIQIEEVEELVLHSSFKKGKLKKTNYVD